MVSYAVISGAVAVFLGVIFAMDATSNHRSGFFWFIAGAGAFVGGQFLAEIALRKTVFSGGIRSGDTERLFLLINFGGSDAGDNILHRACREALRMHAHRGRRTRVEKVCADGLIEILEEIRRLRPGMGQWTQCGLCSGSQ